MIGELAREGEAPAEPQLNMRFFRLGRSLALPRYVSRLGIAK
jgi:hypothetical protein